MFTSGESQRFMPRIMYETRGVSSNVIYSRTTQFDIALVSMMHRDVFYGAPTLRMAFLSNAGFSFGEEKYISFGGENPFR